MAELGPLDPFEWGVQDTLSVTRASKDKGTRFTGHRCWAIVGSGFSWVERDCNIAAGTYSSRLRPRLGNTRCLALYLEAGAGQSSCAAYLLQVPSAGSNPLPRVLRSASVGLLGLQVKAQAAQTSTNSYALGGLAEVNFTEA